MSDIDDETFETLREIADALQPLLELSNAVIVVQKGLEADLNKKERTNLEDAAKKFEDELKSKCLEFSNEFIDGWRQDSSVSVQQFFNMQLDMMKQELEDENHLLAIEHLRTQLIKTLDVETAKSPTRRKIEKHGWWITILAVLCVAVLLKGYFLVDVNEELENTEGLIQRAEVFQKAFDYDDYMDTRVRKGGLFKGILFWPVEPTDEEMEFAGEFMQYAMMVYLYLKEERLICGAGYTFDLENRDISDGEISLLNDIAGFIANTQVADYENSAELGIAAFEFKYPCE